MSENDRAGSKSHRPMYYGGQPSRQLYYGGSSPSLYSSSSSYGSPAYYGGGAYGGSYYGGNGGNGGDDDSLVGTVTLSRMIRVCTQRWVTIIVFTIVGLIIAFAVFKVSPTIYETSSLFEMSIRKPSIMGGRGAIIDTDMGSSLDEVFNTRLASLRSRAIFEQIITMYRSEHPSSTVTDEELIGTLGDSKMDLQRRSKLIKIIVRSTNPKLATDLANSYAKAAEIFMSDRNKDESESAVSWLTTQTEQAKRNLERADKEMLDFRTANQIDFMTSESTTAQQALDKINGDILNLDGDITKAAELKRTLEAIQSDPDKFGSLPESVPRSSEIGSAYQLLEKTRAEKNSLLARYTANHPEVRVKEKEVEIYKQQFGDVIARALETCKANLELLQRQLSQLTPKRDAETKKISELELKIVSAKMRLEQLSREREVADSSYQALLKRAQEAQYAADENTAIIKLVEKAYEPKTPVLPNPLIIFPIGFVAGLVLGVFFVLVIDHLEDKIIGIGDIEQRLRLKPLIVLPHVRRKNREQIARLVVRDKFSQFAESVASLRNLLDSPRYHEMSKVLLIISTQPGEGKTITSCSLAASCALSGQRTVLIDFDMRRPRIARIFEKNPKEFSSLPHTLVRGDPKFFDSLPVSSGTDNLDLILSKASSEISPAMLMGSEMVSEFFKWVREHYDRVIVDSPPFGIVGDVMTLASQVDAVMMMCCPDRTRFNTIKHAVRQLTEAGARVIGAVVNDVDMDRHKHFGGEYDYHYRYAYKYGAKYYSGYGYGYGPKGKKRSTAAAAAVGSSDASKIADQEEKQEVSLDATKPAASDSSARPSSDQVDMTLTDDD